MKPLILASGSPRRAKILRDLSVEFEIVKTEAPEVAIPHDPVRTVTENACAKLHAAVEQERDPPEVVGRAILAADTIVWFANRIYGKPRDLEEAKEFLRELSGETHVVFTGVAFRTADGAERTACVE
jgi:septum formation protein